MCGRTACTLDADNIQKACCYPDQKIKKFCKPKWRDVSNGGRAYSPSYNVAPTNITPVLVCGSHFNEGPQRVVQPMMWGMIPPWHKGDYKSHGLTTNNCRIENLESSKLYKKPFLQGQRCVIVCDGFYEWQTTKGKGQKQPFFIYSPQKDGIKIEDNETWDYSFDEENGWSGPNLLKMAGLFSSWTSPEGEEIYSYTIITLESNETLSWLHHRMPAILDTEEALSNWLDCGRVSSSESLLCIKPIKMLVWHPVSTLVNNSRNKDVMCNKPVKTEEEKPKKPSFMDTWLKTGSKVKSVKEETSETPPSDKRSSSTTGCESTKRIKLENSD